MKVGEKTRTSAKKVMDLKEVFTDSFINKVMANIHLKIYDFCETEAQKNRKKSFKNDFIRIYKEKILEESIRIKQDKVRGVYEEPIDPKEGIPDAELEMIDNFLSGFVLSGDGSKRDQIDIKLALKALPSQVDENNVFRCELFRFECTKKSLIAFQNDD
jgi:hypothetical protein